jgi:predicted esterase YcpF (UPF0227 family)
LNVLYFHGFASSPNSEKVRSLRALLAPDVDLTTPDLNVPSFRELDFDAMAALGVDEGRRIAPRVIVGSSLGALVALRVVHEIRAPLVLIAPAIGFGERWRTKLPDGDPIDVFNHALGSNAPIHRAFFLRMAELDVDRDPPSVPVTIFMGTNDESVPFAQVASTWQQWRDRLIDDSLFVEIAKADHGLTKHVELIANEIRRRCR